MSAVLRATSPLPVPQRCSAYIDMVNQHWANCPILNLVACSLKLPQTAQLLMTKIFNLPHSGGENHKPRN
jgi:hypothetical protein